MEKQVMKIEVDMDMTKAKEQIVSLKEAYADIDPLILKSDIVLKRERIEIYEKELSEKLNRKVVIIPHGLEVVDEIKDKVENIYKGIKDVASRLGTDLNEAINNKKQNLDKENKEKQYKLMSKDDYLTMKMDKAKEHHEELWYKISKGEKYVVYLDQGNETKHFYSLGYFYNNKNIDYNILDS